MKKQYLGDVRDLFKYDLIQQILTGRKASREFAFIPMLTENKRNSKDGNKRDFVQAKQKSRPGTNNAPLIKVLEKYKEMDENNRDFREIGLHFKSNGIEMVLYEGDYFDRRTGDVGYFKNIPKRILRAPLVFIDPDNGLQIKDSTEKHLLFSEAKYIYDHMDRDSVLMIYQHFPRARRKHKEYLPKGRSNKLEKELGTLPVFITDNEIIFFLLTRSDRIRGQIGGIITRYKKDYQDYPTLEIGGAV